MKKTWNPWALVLSYLLATSLVWAESLPPLPGSFKVDLRDKPALQRGAQLFMNHCSGCHGLRYLRYQGMAEDLGITDIEGNLLEEAVKKNLLFTGDKLSDPIYSALKPEDGANWFGVAPPDLSLVTRSRGANWVYHYLRGFYEDEKRPFGVNNTVYPAVAMPHVLLALQGKQVLRQKPGQEPTLELETPGTLTPDEFDRAMQDLVSFLVYAGDPHQEKRRGLGVWVLLFLGIFFVFAFLLKKAYWKDIE